MAFTTSLTSALIKYKRSKNNKYNQSIVLQDAYVYLRAGLTGKGDLRKERKEEPTEGLKERKELSQGEVQGKLQKGRPGI